MQWIHMLRPSLLGDPCAKIQLVAVGNGLEVERAVTVAELRKILDGTEDKYELENACLPVFSSLHWPFEDQNACSASRTDAERNQVVLRRMDNWTVEIEARQSIES